MKENIWLAIQQIADGKKVEEVLSNLPTDDRLLVADYYNVGSVPLGDMWV